MTKATRFGAGVLVAIGLAVAFAMLGPQPRVDDTIRLHALPSDLDSLVEAGPEPYDDLRPGTAPVIVWAGEPNARTQWSIVYVHGFSATPPETRPLCDTIAARLGANLYYPLLTGHGRTGDAMAEASANDWLNDMAEALAVGRMLGKHMIVVGTSTGATLATWSAIVGDTSAVKAYVFVSPNFGPRDERSEILLWPWGGLIANVMVGKMREWQPANEQQAAFWTTSYPTRALLPMMAMVERVGSADLSEIQIPVQIVASPQDQVINFHKAVAALQAFGSQTKRLTLIDNSTDLSHHVIAGDILSPSTTMAVADSIMIFLQPIVGMQRQTPPL